MSRFLKHTLRCVVFLAVLALLLTGVSQLVRPKNNTRSDGIHDPAANGILGEPDNTIDLLILGDSESYSAFIPMQLWQQYGYTAYCCGTSRQMKKTLTPEQAENHPARWCLAEVCNVHSPAIEIEPIHRVLFNVDCAAVLLALITWSDENMAGCCFGGEKKQPFTLAGPHMANVLSFEEPTAPLTVGTIDEFIEYYLERHPEGRVDYVHDEPAVRALCKKGAVAFLMPPFAKSDLFKGVVMGGVLPRKTFSMGHAEEKRYYIECRKITE